jgi:hypothetical protein
MFGVSKVKLYVRRKVEMVKESVHKCICLVHIIAVPRSQKLGIHPMSLSSHGNDLIRVTAEIYYFGDSETTWMIAVLYRRLGVTEVLQSNPSYSDPYP